MRKLLLIILDGVPYANWRRLFGNLEGWVDSGEARVRLDRKIAALRQLEALRLYATQTGGLPEKLENTKLPLVLDPMHGKPFEYTRKSATEGVLRGMPMPLDKKPVGLSNTVHYDVQWKK